MTPDPPPTKGRKDAEAGRHTSESGVSDTSPRPTFSISPSQTSLGCRVYQMPTAVQAANTSCLAHKPALGSGRLQAPLYETFDLKSNSGQPLRLGAVLAGRRASDGGLARRTGCWAGSCPSSLTSPLPSVSSLPPPCSPPPPLPGPPSLPSFIFVWLKNK